MATTRRVCIGEVPVIRHTNELAAAAAQLATERCAYVLPATMESPEGILTGNEQRLTALVSALNEQHPWWMAQQFSRKHIAPRHDIGMHGNPLYHNPPGIVDYLQYHHTSHGSHVVTFALDRPRYLEEKAVADPLLTAALRENKTYPRYADPNTFQQAAINPGDAVVFRLNDPEGACLLHDFRTTSEAREANFFALQRYDLPEDVIS